MECFSVAGSGENHHHDTTGADPDLKDVLLSCFSPQCPFDGAGVSDLVILRQESDLVHFLELAADLVSQRLLVDFVSQQFRPLLLELPKKGPWVCSASAWTKSTSRSSFPKSCLRTGPSWFSTVA